MTLTLLPDPSWLPLVLAGVLAVDVLMSLRPPKFIRDCFNGVGFPREWWWTLLVIKSLAVAGLVAGNWLPGVGLAATVGVVVYFICAAISHVRAKFTGRDFWLNCLGMLALSVAVLVFAYLV